MVSRAIVLGLIVLTTGCSLIQPKPPVEVKIITKPVQRVITQPVLPRAIDLKDPAWYVVSEANLDEFLERVKKEQGQLVFFAMSVSDYELMAYNMQEIKRWVKEMKQVVIYYRKVTIEEKIDGQE
jgi:hypothetical protein